MAFLWLRPWYKVDFNNMIAQLMWLLSATVGELNPFNVPVHILCIYYR